MSKEELKTDVPTKEEILKFYNDKIEVDTLRLQLAQINSEIAQHDAKRMQALSIIAQLQVPDQTLVVSKEDLENNPELGENGVEEGDVITLKDGIVSGIKEKRKLKKE
jgi:hypothetical protein